MNQDLTLELERVTRNATFRREDLQHNALYKLKRKKLLNVIAGVLALLSAGAITVVLSNIFGDRGMQLIAAAIAAVSGTISLVMNAYFSDEEIINMLTGASKYLSLRHDLSRTVVQPEISDVERFKRLEELQNDYARLDEAYSRYFSLSSLRRGTGDYHMSPRLQQQRAMYEEAEVREVERLHSELARSERRKHTP